MRPALCFCSESLGRANRRTLNLGEECLETVSGKSETDNPKKWRNIRKNGEKLRAQGGKIGENVNERKIERRKCGKALDKRGKMCFNLHRANNPTVMYY